MEPAFAFSTALRFIAARFAGVAHRRQPSVRPSLLRSSVLKPSLLTTRGAWIKSAIGAKICQPRCGAVKLLA